MQNKPEPGRLDPSFAFGQFENTGVSSPVGQIDNHNLANIYFPESKLSSKDGLLVGFNFEGFLFVITSVIPRDEIQSPSQLQKIVNEPKFQTFKWYCAGDPLILGVIETVDQTAPRNQVPLSKLPEILEFKQNKNIWITIEKRKNT
jgi:hypothetical protein